MPRFPRFDLTGIPQHVVQRGNDRQPCFRSAEDFHFYRTELRLMALREGCEVHAYVLMTNHAHLLLTPLETGAVARTMQSLGRRFVRYFNDKYERTGTLWEGRYKASLIGEGDYLANCHRYIELNPVRAKMVSDPGDYPWSSYAALAWGKPDPLVTEHPMYQALSDTPETRQEAYRNMVMAGLDVADLEAIRCNLRRQHAYGTEAFRCDVEARSGRPAGPRKTGRPGKSHLKRRL